VVLRTANRWGESSPTLIDDLIQEVYLKICGERKQVFGEFTPHHPEAFYGYLKVITANVVQDHFRAQRSQKRGHGQADALLEEGVVEPRAAFGTSAVDNVHNAVLMREVEGALCAGLVGQDLMRDRTIFWLYYRDGLSASAIARLPSISLTVKGVESVIHRLTRMVRERLTERDKALG